MANNYESSMSSLYEICHLPKNASLEEIKEIYQIFYDNFTKRQLDRLEDTTIIIQNCAFIKILQMKQEEEKLNVKKRLNPESTEFFPLFQKRADFLSVNKKVTQKQNQNFELITDLLSNDKRPIKLERFSLNTSKNFDQNDHFQQIPRQIVRNSQQKATFFENVNQSTNQSQDLSKKSFHNSYKGSSIAFVSNSAKFPQQTHSITKPTQSLIQNSNHKKENSFSKYELRPVLDTSKPKSFETSSPHKSENENFQSFHHSLERIGKSVYGKEFIESVNSKSRQLSAESQQNSSEIKRNAISVPVNRTIPSHLSSNSINLNESILNFPKPTFASTISTTENVDVSPQQFSQQSKTIYQTRFPNTSQATVLNSNTSQLNPANKPTKFQSNSKPTNLFETKLNPIKTTIDQNIQPNSLKNPETLKQIPQNVEAKLTVPESLLKDSQKRPIEKEASQPKQNKSQTKCPPIKRDLPLTLEDVAKGGTKLMKITRKILKNGIEFQDEHNFNVPFQAGVKTNATILFENEGNQSIDSLPGDIIFTVKDIPHSNFKRVNQFDIEYTEYTVEKQTCYEMKIPIDREFVKFINERGSLIVRFKIVTEQELEKIQSAKKNAPESPTITKHDFSVTLEEVFKGCQKLVSIKRKRFDDKEGEKLVEASFTIDIKPGAPVGEEKLLPQEGDQLPDGTFTDLVFCLQTAPHQKFTRQGADLKYIAKVSESQLKNREEILIPTLDGKTFKVKLDDEVIANDSKKFFGRGLPYPSDTRMKGSILVQFQVVSEEEARKCAIQTEPKVIAQKPKVSIEKNEQNEQNKIKVNLPKLNPNQCKIQLTLEEIYSFCQKEQSFFRKVTDENGKSESQNVRLMVPIKPGSIEGTTIQIENQGDMEHGKSQADIIFTVEEIKHPIFTRVDHDLKCDLQVTKSQLENGGHFDIPTLEGKPKKIQLEGPIKENFVKKIAKFGFPFLDEPKKFGNILVKFVLKPEIKPKIKDPDIEQNLGITLEEIFTGCTKKLKVNRQVLDSEGKEHFSDEIISIVVPPGCKEGHKLRFPNFGDEFLDRIPADIVFTIKYKAHSKCASPLGPALEDG